MSLCLIKTQWPCVSKSAIKTEPFRTYPFASEFSCGCSYSIKSFAAITLVNLELTCKTEF